MEEENTQTEDVIAKSETEKTFLLTDGCMWEANKKNGTSFPHSIEVVDEETGQVRFIKSGARIKFVSGSISVARNQEDYNEINENKA